MQASPTIIKPKTSRNAPCGCGSGKKFKKCCLPSIEKREHASMMEITEEREWWNGRPSWAEANADILGPLSETDDFLIERLFTIGDALPRSVVDVYIKRGNVLTPYLSSIIYDESNWYAPQPRCWSTFHATCILGAIGGDAVVDPLVVALHYASENFAEEVLEMLPAILGSLGESALHEVSAIAEDRNKDWLARWTACEALAAIALKNTQKKDEICALLARIMCDKTEKASVRASAGEALLNCIPAKYKEELLQFAEEQASDEFDAEAFFDTDDIRLAFFEGHRETTRLTHDWLEFYDEAVREKRQAADLRMERRCRWYWRILDWFLFLPVCKQIWLWKIKRDTSAFFKERERRIAVMNEAEGGKV
jgi:hypothetical protein